MVRRRSATFAVQSAPLPLVRGLSPSCLTASMLPLSPRHGTKCRCSLMFACSRCFAGQGRGSPFAWLCSTRRRLRPRLRSPEILPTSSRSTSLSLRFRHAYRPPPTSIACRSASQCASLAIAQRIARRFGRWRRSPRHQQPRRMRSTLPIRSSPTLRLCPNRQASTCLTARAASRSRMRRFIPPRS